MKLRDFKVLTFDVYGTLIDWESGIWDALQPLLMANGRNDITRSKALAAFADAESAQESETPGLLYPELLERVHRAMAGRFGLETSAEPDAAFGGSSGRGGSKMGSSMMALRKNLILRSALARREGGLADTGGLNPSRRAMQPSSG